MGTKRQYEDLTGKTFGLWKVLRQAKHRDRRDPWLWECECECGVTKTVRSSNLTAGLSKSCGCSRITTRKKMEAKDEPKAP